MLQIVKAKLDRAERAQKISRLMLMRQPDRPAPTEQDWINCAAALKCPPANLLAVKAVESGGSAFNSDGRLVLAYEDHIFGRLTKHRFAKTHPHLTRRGFKHVRDVAPSDPHPHKLSQEDRWMLLAEACELDFDAAIQSCSYGMWQIMGFNYGLLNFNSPMHMIEIMYDGYEGQWECFLRFCRAKGCLDALRKGDWATFERLYNGGGQKGAYAKRLAHYQSQYSRSLA
jgi:hypothetical protein